MKINGSVFRRSVHAACLGVILFNAKAFAAVSPKSDDPQEISDIRVLNRFYRQAQILGSWMKADVGLEVIPDYYMDLGDFPYMKKATPKEVPFADRITISRFLGGWGPKFGGIKNIEEARSLDLVHRNADGSLVYNWGGQMDYFQNYLNAGVKEVILSIDNIPWDLARDPKLADYGQSQPQRDIREWQTFFDAFLDEMGKRYGSDFMNTVSFRVGTEFNGTHTYTGDFKTYIEWYDCAAASLKKKFPGAKIGPCEVAGSASPTDNINFTDVVTHLLKTPDKDEPSLGFIANSSHAYPVWRNGVLGGAVDPRQRAAVNVSVYEHLLGTHLNEAKDIPTYIFQFGVLRSEVRNSKGEYLESDEPGARGAAWSFITLMETWRLWPAIKGIGHWDVSADVPGQPQMRLLKGNGWVYTVLDHLCGREVYAVPADTAKTAAGSFCKSYAFIDPSADRQFLMVATFNTDRTATNKIPVEITLPSSLTGLTGSVAVRSCALTFETSPFSALREDLLNAGLLPEDYRLNARLVADTRAYASGTPGLKQKMDGILKTNFDRYREILKDSLTLKPYAGEVVSHSGAVSLKMQLDVPAVYVIELSCPDK